MRAPRKNAAIGAPARRATYSVIGAEAGSASSQVSTQPHDRKYAGCDVASSPHHTSRIRVRADDEIATTSSVI